MEKRVALVIPDPDLAVQEAGDVVEMAKRLNEAVDFHGQAMEAADQALFERLAGRTQQAREKLKRAFELERRAALALGSRVDLEPTRSVLFRSAASLGLECEQYREAERLVALGLSGDPPEEIADELRHLLDQINFQPFEEGNR